MNREVESVILGLISRAKALKARSKTRLKDLGPDWRSRASRGPLLPNGRRCYRWHLWMRSIENHKRATKKVAAIIRATGCKPEGLR